MTLAIKLIGATAAPNAPIINLPSPAEQNLFASPNVIEWFRADSGYAGTSWTGRKAGTVMTVNSPGSLSLVTGDLGKPAIRREVLSGPGPYTTFLSPPDVNLWPLTGGYTFIWVAKDSPGTAAIGGGIVCNMIQSGAYVGYGSGSTAPDSFVIRHSGLVATQPGLVTVDVPQAIIWSFDYGTRIGELINSDGNTVFTSPQTSAGNVPTSGRVSLFGNRDESNSFISAGGFNGDLYDLVICNKAAHTDSALLGLITDYIQTYYSGAV